ncbi:MAG: hypothetical protein M5R40_13220 [Anaerolineae bacterium]|nr:hypothetical protein [Anaerolineae bacterium]
MNAPSSVEIELASMSPQTRPVRSSCTRCPLTLPRTAPAMVTLLPATMSAVMRAFSPTSALPSSSRLPSKVPSSRTLPGV